MATSYSPKIGTGDGDDEVYDNTQDMQQAEASEHAEYVARDQEGEDYYEDAKYYEYYEQPLATDGGHYDYQGGYDEAPPEVAESDVSSKEGGGESRDKIGRKLSESSLIIEEAKRIAASEGTDSQSMEVEIGGDNRRISAVEDISDRSDDDEAHAQARAYRHQAQAERKERKSRVSDLIQQFESSP